MLYAREKGLRASKKYRLVTRAREKRSVVSSRQNVTGSWRASAVPERDLVADGS